MRMWSTVNHFPAPLVQRMTPQEGWLIPIPIEDGILPCVSVFDSLAKAGAFVMVKSLDLIERGEFEFSSYRLHEPPPIAAGSKVRVGGSASNPIEAPAPSHVECVVFEIRLRRLRDGMYCFYRVAQHPVS